MFFTDNHQALSFKLSLIPITKSKTIRAVTINIEGQIQQYTSLNHSSSILTWPGPNPGQASLTTSFYKGKDLNQSFNGPWALFRLIQSATLTPSDDPQKYTLQFKFDKSDATYHLIADNRINPFIPNVLSQFKCPDTL
jgi:type VI secretion system protein ImpL